MEPESSIELLKTQVELLQRNSVTLIQAIHQLTNPDVMAQMWPTVSRKRHTEPVDVVPKKSTWIPCKNNCVEKSTQTQDNQLPLEVFDAVFRYLSRDDLDRCQLVCRPWNLLIKKNSKNLAKRVLHLLKFVCKDDLAQLSASAGSKRKEFAFPKDEIEGVQLYSCITRLLQNTTVKRWVILNVSLTDEICRLLQNTLPKVNLEIVRVEMLAMNLSQVSAPGFHRFIGQTINATQYFLEAVRGARSDHFDRGLMEQESVLKAEDFTIYDVKSMGDLDLSLDLNDDILISHIFGTSDLPARNSLYLDSPNISATLKFVKAPSVESMVSHVEIAHCRDQIIHDLPRDVVMEYEHAIQVEYSATNKQTGRMVEIRISRTMETDEFCHVTINSFT